MGLWSSIKEKLSIGVGHVRLAILGDTRWGESHWVLERRGYDNNIHLREMPMVRAIFVGDTGKSGPQRDMVARAMREAQPTHVFLLGDLGYPKGITDQDELDFHVMGPYGDLGHGHVSTHLVPGNHDAYGSKSERGFLFKRLFNGPIGKVEFPNFYGANVYPPAEGHPPTLVAWYDSTVYDVAIGDPEIQDRQEGFIGRVLADPRFDGHTRIAIAHAGAFSNGSHGKTNSRDYMRFYLNRIAPRANYLIAGHDHIIDNYGLILGTDNWTSGSGSKLKSGETVKARPGYLEYSFGQLKAVPVACGFLMEDEDDH